MKPGGRLKNMFRAIGWVIVSSFLWCVVVIFSIARFMTNSHRPTRCNWTVELRRVGIGRCESNRIGDSLRECKHILLLCSQRWRRRDAFRTDSARKKVQWRRTVIRLQISSIIAEWPDSRRLPPIQFTPPDSNPVLEYQLAVTGVSAPGFKLDEQRKRLSCVCAFSFIRYVET